VSAIPMVLTCGNAVPESSCTALTGGHDVGPVPVLSSALSALSWGRFTTDSSCGSGLSYKPVYQATSADYVGLYWSDGSFSCVPASAVTYGVGGLTPPFDLSQIDTVAAEQSFAAGFVLVGMFWALGKAISAILSVVRR